MFNCYDCCVLSGTSLCDELIAHPEESYRLWCIVVCDVEASRMRRLWPTFGDSATNKISVEGSGSVLKEFVVMICLELSFKRCQLS